MTVAEFAEYQSNYAKQMQALYAEDPVSAVLSGMSDSADRNFEGIWASGLALSVYGGAKQGWFTGGVGDAIKFGSDTKSAAKLARQMAQRGWTESSVRGTVSSPFTTRVSTNMATGNSASVYYNQAGAYVIIDDITMAVVQVSDNINPSTWIPDPNIIDPYKP